MENYIKIISKSPSSSSGKRVREKADLFIASCFSNLHHFRRFPKSTKRSLPILHVKNLCIPILLIIHPPQIRIRIQHGLHCGRRSYFCQIPYLTTHFHRDQVAKSSKTGLHDPRNPSKRQNCKKIGSRAGKIDINTTRSPSKRVMKCRKTMMYDLCAAPPGIKSDNVYRMEYSTHSCFTSISPPLKTTVNWYIIKTTKALSTLYQTKGANEND